MKTLFALTAVSLMTAALSVPASAGTIGCDVGNANASVNATNCSTWQETASQPTTGKSAFAYVAPSRAQAAPSTLYNPTADDEGVKGGAGN